MACGQNNSLDETVRRRLGFVLFVFSAWIIILMARLADFMIFSRDSLIATTPEQRVIQILKPARRGSIKLESGERLAWSELVYELIWKASETPDEIESQRKQLVEAGFEIELTTPSEAVVLKESSKLQDMSEFIKLAEKLAWLETKSVFVRHHKGDIELIGEVVNGHGVSGFEKKYDEKLRGSDGLYETVSNSRGKLMPERSTVIKSLKNGKDVIVSLEGNMD